MLEPGQILTTERSRAKPVGVAPAMLQHDPMRRNSRPAPSDLVGFRSQIMAPVSGDVGCRCITRGPLASVERKCNLDKGS